LIDNKLYGRKWMMQIGFLLDFILFVVPAFHYKYYSGIKGVHAFQAMYFLSSFFNQFGPNAVTFLVAAEVYPTPIRATAHGFSAACGKLGALLAAILYNYISVQMRFYVVPWFGLMGMAVTFLFLPDTTGLDLKEQERRWNYIRAGRSNEYHGIAVHPKHLSLWERWTGVGKYYNPKQDRLDRLKDSKDDWVEHMASKYGVEEGLEYDDDLPFSKDAHDYFKSQYGHEVQAKAQELSSAESNSEKQFREKPSPDIAPKKS